MNEFELKSFLKWMKAIGVETLGQIAWLKAKCGLDSKSKMLNFANGCAVYELTFDDLK